MTAAAPDTLDRNDYSSGRATGGDGGENGRYSAPAQLTRAVLPWKNQSREIQRMGRHPAKSSEVVVCIDCADYVKR